jgi:hypothetical protein
MAKDALGHGSDGKGDGNGLHSAGVNKLGFQRGQINPTPPFGKRTSIPELPTPSHSSKIGALATSFLHSESGEGRPIPGLEASTDPEVIHHAIGAVHEALGGDAGLSAIVHLAHYLAFLGAVGIVTVLVQWVSA